MKSIFVDVLFLFQFVLALAVCATFNPEFVTCKTVERISGLCGQNVVRYKNGSVRNIVDLQTSSF